MEEGEGRRVAVALRHVVVTSRHPTAASRRTAGAFVVTPLQEMAPIRT